MQIKSIIQVFVNSIFFLILSSHINLSAQQVVIDSLLNVAENENDTTQCMIYGRLYAMTFQQDLTQAEEYAKLSFKAAQDSKNDNFIAKANNLMGIHNLQLSRYDEALDYLKVSRDYYLELGNSQLALRPWNNIAIVQQRQGKIEESLLSHMEILKELQRTEVGGDQLASCYWNIGNVKKDLIKYEESIEWFNKAKEIYIELKDTLYLTELKFNIANAQSMNGNLEEAEKGFLECIKYYESANMVIAKAGALDNLGSIYTDQKRYELAEETLKEAIILSRTNNGGYLDGQIYRRFTKLYMASGDLRSAEKYAQLSLDNAKEYGRDKKIISDYQLLSEVYEKTGKYKPALENFKSFHAQNDSIFGLEKMNSINAIQVEYETFKREQDAILFEEQSKRAKLERNGLILGIIGLLTLLGALFFGAKQRLEKNKIAKQKVDQELEFSNKELERKKQELTAYALQLAHKNEVLEGIKTDVNGIKEHNSRTLQRIVNTIDFNQNDNESWDGFRTRFQAVHKDFDTSIKSQFPKVTSNELRLMSLLKMNLSNKEVANILNISPDGIKKARYRLRKKLGLETGDSLEDLILAL